MSLDARRTDSQWVAHFQEEFDQSMEGTVLAKFLIDLEETISQTLLLAYAKARQANTKRWGDNLNSGEPIYIEMSKPGGMSKAPSKDHTPNKRIKWVTGGRSEYSEGESEEDPEEDPEEVPEEDPEEDLVPSQPYNPDEKDPEEEDPEDKPEDDPEYEPGEYSEDDD